MIGQKNLIDIMSKQIEANTFPRFSIIVGERGSGKNILARLIAHKISKAVIETDIKVGSIRDIITEAYKISNIVVYIIPDADNMSVNAKNALLKVTEEPPNNAYFIMTLNDVVNTLPTITSRGTVYRLQTYTYEELSEYANQIDSNISNADKDFIMRTCNNPYDIKLLLKYGVADFKDYVNTVIDNVAEVSLANAFKIADKIDLKENDETKYNLNIFWKAFMQMCLELKKYKWVMITNKYISSLRISGINKSALFDMWIIDLTAEVN